MKPAAKLQIVPIVLSVSANFTRRTQLITDCIEP